MKIGWSESIESTHKPEKPTDLPVLSTTRFYGRGKYDKFKFHVSLFLYLEEIHKIYYMINK